jgi:selenocysteine lyase/cysteine desulfurase
MQPGSDEHARFRAAYRRFLEPKRILLSGHSHQAWPDAAREAQLAAFDDAARWVDDKWDKAVFPLADEVGRGVLKRMGFAEDDPIAFGDNTHQLVYRLLSCFAPHERPRVVTTTSEFHSLHRQLSRLAEEGFDVVWVPGRPRATLTQRLLDALTPGTRLLAVSAVMFEDAYVLDDLAALIERATQIGAVPLIDAYHAFNAVPLDWGPAGEQALVVAGGYKYAAFGDGVCWLRFPTDCELRPAYTGWFADFAGLADSRDGVSRVRYGAGGARFRGATFDASALYRARAVLRHWQRFGLDVPALRALSLHQTRRIIGRIDGADLAPELVSSRDDARRGSFVTLRMARAGEAVSRLRDRGVWVDARGDLLRLGPAPYLSDDEIDRGVDALLEVAAELQG